MFRKIKRRIVLLLISIVRYCEGRFFLDFRKILYRQILKKAGRNLAIHPGVIIKEPENLEIGDNVSFQHFCFISAYGGIKIGSDVSIATGTKIFSSSHPFSNPKVKIRYGKLLKEPVEIGDNVWLGAGVIVTGGVNVGSGVVVGAGSVVVDNLKDEGVYAGVPARFIKKRF